jgi:hypothetical protein
MLKIIALFFIFLLLLPVTAHAAENEQRYTVFAGSYAFELIIGSSALKTATDYPVMVRFGNEAPLTATNQNVTISLIAEPLRGTSATPVKINLTANGDGKSWDGKMSIPISGRWSMKITAEYPGGKGNGTTIISVSPPPALPNWLAWALGLAPVIIFVAFIAVIGRQALKKRKLEFEVVPSPLVGEG